MASRFLSPYDFNPLNINPLRELLEAHVDFEAIRRSDVKVFISATNVQTGRARIFGHEEMSADAVMASACLPFLFQAVEIDGVPYWDGGYMGNPPLFPLYEHAEADDILLVQINPIRREETPRTAAEIQNRINEITFNASLLAQLRVIDQVTQMAEKGLLSRLALGGSGYRRVPAAPHRRRGPAGRPRRVLEAQCGMGLLPAPARSRAGGGGCLPHRPWRRCRAALDAGPAAGIRRLTGVPPAHNGWKRDAAGRPRRSRQAGRPTGSMRGMRAMTGDAQHPREILRTAQPAVEKLCRPRQRPAEPDARHDARQHIEEVARRDLGGRIGRGFQGLHALGRLELAERAGDAGSIS